MEDLIKKYSSSLPAILLVFYFLGYLYLKSYFLQFDVSIENYITLTDLVYISAENLLIVVTVYGVLMVLFRLLKVRQLQERIWRKIEPKISLINISKKTSYKHLYDYFFILGIFLGFLAFRVAFFDNETLPSHIMIGTPVYYTFIFLPDPFEGKPIRTHSLIFVFFVFVIFFISRGYFESFNYRYNCESKDRWEFSSEGRSFRVDCKELFFIGETSNYVFLFNGTEIKTITVKRSEISIIENRLQ